MMIATNGRNLQPKPAAVMVVGGGIGGMRAALDLADSGLKVYLVEQTLPGRARRTAWVHVPPTRLCAMPRHP